MDEVDKIVLSSLKDIGYTPREDIASLKDYPFQELLGMVMHCLRAIRPEASFPTSLPPTMSNRYQICAQFAETCKELGYKRDIGYHTFMYNNTTDVRNVLIFLVEHLPKQNLLEESSDNLDRCLSIKQKMGDELRSIFASKTKSGYIGSTCQSPFLAVDLETGTLLPNQKIDCKPIEWRDFIVEELPFIDEQLPFSRSLLPSVITLNANGLINAPRSKSKCWNRTNITDEDLLKTLSSQSYSLSGYSDSLRSARLNTETLDTSGCVKLIDGLQIDSNAGSESMQDGKSAVPTTSEAEEIIVRLRDEINDSKTQIKGLKTKLAEISENNELAKKKLREKMSHVTSLEQSIALLPDSENNVPKLEAANEKCRAKIRKLEEQWKQHKEQLLAKRSELLEINGHKLNEKNELLKTISDARKELFDVTEEIQRRSAIEERLKEAELGDGVQRSQFIDRILEMINNIKKQETQIQNILNDMKSVQKEINTLSGKIERSFTVTDKTISANTDELSRESHKLIVVLHKNISDILKMIDETGKYARDIKDLEDQIRDGNNNVEEALKQVLVDLERIKEDQLIRMKEIKKIYNSKDDE